MEKRYWGKGEGWNDFTIEPMINLGSYETRTLNDGWTAVTKDKHYQHNLNIQ